VGFEPTRSIAPSANPMRDLEAWAVFLDPLGRSGIPAHNLWRGWDLNPRRPKPAGPEPAPVGQARGTPPRIL